MALADFESCKRLALASLAQLTEAAARVDSVPLAQSLGRISAEDVSSPCNIPAQPTSIKDGYAARSQDLSLPTSTEFEVQFRVLAGDAQQRRLEPGKVAYVTTGSPLPLGADCVVEVEQTTVVSANATIITIKSPSIKPGTDVRQPGSDLKLGELVLRHGMRIGPGEIGALASIGRFRGVKVVRQPRVGVLATGDELVSGESDAQHGQVFDCNRPMLLAAIAELGCVGVDLGICSDSEASTRLPTMINAAFLQSKGDGGGVDLLISTGGVSVGDADCIRLLLQELAASNNNKTQVQVLFDRVNTKPGKPVTCAVLELPIGGGGTRTTTTTRGMMFSLPGNPVSALAMFHVLVAPCLRAMMGCDFTDPNAVYSTTTCDIKLDSRPEFQRVKLQVLEDEGLISSTPTGRLQRSSCVMSLVGCDALICLPSGPGVLPKGSVVKTLVFSDWRTTQFPVIGSPVPTTMPPSVVVDRVCLLRPADGDDGGQRVLFERLEAALHRRTAAPLQVLPFTSLAGMAMAMAAGTGEGASSPAGSGDSNKKTQGANAQLVVIPVAGIDEVALPSAFIPIPGIPQFIREQLNIVDDLLVGSVASSSSSAPLLLMLMPASLTDRVEDVFRVAWPVLRAALFQLSRA